MSLLRFCIIPFHVCISKMCFVNVIELMYTMTHKFESTLDQTEQKRKVILPIYKSNSLYATIHSRTADSLGIRIRIWTFLLLRLFGNYILTIVDRILASLSPCVGRNLLEEQPASAYWCRWFPLQHAFILCVKVWPLMCKDAPYIPY